MHTHGGSFSGCDSSLRLPPRSTTTASTAALFFHGPRSGHSRAFAPHGPITCCRWPRAVCVPGLGKPHRCRPFRGDGERLVSGLHVGGRANPAQPAGPATGRLLPISPLQLAQRPGGFGLRVFHRVRPWRQRSGRRVKTDYPRDGKHSPARWHRFGTAHPPMRRSTRARATAKVIAVPRASTNRGSRLAPPSTCRAHRAGPRSRSRNRS